MTLLRHLIPAAFTCTLTVAAAAQSFVGVNANPSPDTLVEFIPEQAASATVSPPFLTLIGNFIRGAEMLSPNSGYFVASAPLSGSPTGFYRISSSGVSAIGPLWYPTSTSVGGMALDERGEKLFYTIEITGQGFRLFEVQFNGAAIDRGQITTAPPLLAPTICGLALNPLTGTLYALDSSNDAILIINPLTLVGTRLGASGVAFSGVGGLDFNDDYSKLIAVAGTGSLVYEVNLSTGAMTQIGDAPVTISSIASKDPDVVFFNQISAPATSQIAGRAGTWKVFDAGQSTERDAGSLTVDSQGRFRIAADLDPGTYDLLIRVPPMLQRRIAGVQVASLAGDATFALINGDLSADNIIDGADINLILENFGNEVGGPGYSLALDANADGVIDGNDINLVLQNFGAEGDE